MLIDSERNGLARCWRERIGGDDGLDEQHVFCGYWLVIFVGGIDDNQREQHELWRNTRTYVSN
jgi:hypothetical protein